MGKASILEQLEGIEQLPTLPVVARQIQKLIAHPNSSMMQIAQVISRDQAVSSRVIRLVNSAFYGLRGRVSSVQQAIVILGLNTVKNLTLGVSVVKAFEGNSNASIFDREQFWIHSFATAMGAKLMAEQLKLREPEDYFLAGLLHDVGILVLDQFFHAEFVEILKQALLSKVEYPEAEKKAIGTNHAEVGEYLARRWQIPGFLGDCMRNHHQPLLACPEDPDSQYKIFLVHIADGLSRKKGLGRFVSNWNTGFEPETLSKTGLSEAQTDLIFDKVGIEVKNLMREWGL